MRVQQIAGNYLVVEIPIVGEKDIRVSPERGGDDVPILLVHLQPDVEIDRTRPRYRCFRKRRIHRLKQVCAVLCTHRVREMAFNLFEYQWAPQHIENTSIREGQHNVTPTPWDQDVGIDKDTERHVRTGRRRSRPSGR